MITDDLKTTGNKVKTARQERGLTVQKLAGQASISDEYLEWLEDGQVEPPVSLLIQLARLLQLDSSTFLADDVSLPKRLEEATKRTKHYSYQTLTPPEVDKHLMAFSVTIPPKTAHEGVGYKHEGEEFVYVLSGEVDLTIEEEKRKLKAKECHRFNANLNHHLSNPGEEEAQLLVILYIP